MDGLSERAGLSFLDTDIRTRSMSSKSVGQALALHEDTVREVLPNGLTLLIRRDTSAPVVAIVTHVKVGYFDESDDIVGIAHVLEHMYFKGTPSRGVGAIARETKANGGYLNAHTIYDHTSYYTVLPSASFVQGLDIQFDAYARSLIDAKELASELEVIIQEANRKRDTATAVTIETLYAQLHDHHRIRRWRIGEESGLRTLTQEALLRFYRTWYTPSNTILSIVGDVDPDVVRREVLARHGMLPRAEVPRVRGPDEIAPPGFRVKQWSGDIAQHHLAFGWRAPSLRHADAPALELAGLALGTGRASRLYRAVRERQLASSISAWHYTTGDLGVFVVHAEAPPQHAADAALQTWREVQAARHYGFRASEIARAQRILEARLLRRLETMDGQATYLASWEADGGLDFAATYHDRLLSLTPPEAHAALARTLDPAQVSVASYRPHAATPIADDINALRDALQAHESAGSSVLPPPSVGTPIVAMSAIADAVADPVTARDITARVAVHGGDGRDAVVNGVHVRPVGHGLTALILPRASTLTSIGVFQRGGGLCEAEGQQGLARLTANAMLKGTTARSGVQIAEASEELGASVGVSASLESLGWSLSVPSRHLGAATDLLADLVQHATFPDDGVTTERSLAIAEAHRVRDDMHRWPMRLAMEAAYGSHPYARSVIGSANSLASLTVNDVRNFHAQHIVRAPTVLAVVGDVDPDDTTRLLSEAFPSLQFAADAPLPPALWPATAEQRVETRDKQQTALAMYFPSPSRRDPDRFAVRVLAAIASGLGGRFFEQLRDRQSLAYTVSAFSIERRAGGLFAAYIATSPAREAEAREGLLREFAKFCETAPSDEEVERAQRYLIGTHAISQQTGSAVLGEMVDAWLFGDGLQERREYAARLDAVTPDAIRQVAATYFDPARVVEGVVRGTLGADEARRAGN